MKSCCEAPPPPGRRRGWRALVVAAIVGAVAAWALAADRARGGAPAAQVTRTADRPGSRGAP